MPISMVSRAGTLKRRAECYLLDANQVYIAGQSVNGSANYKIHVAMLESRIKEKAIDTVDGARAWLEHESDKVLCGNTFPAK